MCCLSSHPLHLSPRCDSPEKLKTLLSRLEQELKDTGKFKDFYQFTFNFAKNPGQKGLGKPGQLERQKREGGTDSFWLRHRSGPRVRKVHSWNWNLYLCLHSIYGMVVVRMTSTNYNPEEVSRICQN